MLIETDRLILREYTLDDFDALFEIMSDPETMQHYPAPFDKEKTMRWIMWNLENYEKYGFGLLAVVLKETGEFIGDCGITIQNIDGEMLPEIGYHIHKKYWRRGFAKEAAQAIRDWVFQNTQYDTIYSYMKYTNVGSYSTAVANGMKKVKEYPDSKNTISYAYAITREEWKAIKEQHFYSQIQLAAKQTIEYIGRVIKPGMSLIAIRKACEEKLLELGADSFWYWDVGAFVFAGDETTISVSGREYITSDRVIENNDIITIDLSPQIGNIWGDYARTIIVENGKVVGSVELIENQEWKSGLQMEDKLHGELLRFVTKKTTFEELYDHMNRFIVENGFVNLDFMGNLGHSIVKNKEDRIYIEKGNQQKLGNVNYFTFEPHIAFPDLKYGYKKENIYYFDGDRLVEL